MGLAMGLAMGSHLSFMAQLRMLPAKTKTTQLCTASAQDDAAGRTQRENPPSNLHHLCLSYGLIHVIPVGDVSWKGTEWPWMNEALLGNICINSRQLLREGVQPCTGPPLIKSVDKLRRLANQTSSFTIQACKANCVFPRCI